MDINNRISLFFLAVVTISILSSGLCHAGSDLSEEWSSTGEELLLFQEIPSVYGASKYEQKVTEAPSSISIITADEIKKYGYRDFGEILRSIRGFQTTFDRNYRYINVRGYGLPGDYNSRILLLIDGHRSNDNIYDSAFIGTEFPMDIDLIERVEVIRGPSSSLYGTNAFFGVINVITRTGRDLKGWEVSAEAASFDTYKERLTYGNRFQNGMELLLSGSYYDSKGDDRLYFREFDDPATNNGIAEDLDYGRFKNFHAKLTLNDFVLQGNHNSRKKGVPTAAYETVFNENLFTVDELTYVDLKYEHAFPGQLNILARLSWNSYKYFGDYRYGGDVEAGEAEIVLNKDFSNGEWLFGELQLTTFLSQQHRVTAGMDYQNNLKLDQRMYYIGATDWGELDDHRKSEHVAIYLQDEFNIIDNLILNAGVRYDYYDTFGGTINPRAAIIYSPAEKSTAKLIYGRAFRAPNAYELYYNDGGNNQKNNLDLNPETIDTYELIYEQYIGDHIRGTIVGFYYVTRDLILQETDPSDELSVFNNIDEVEAHGVEFEIEGKWSSGLEGRINYVYQKTENKMTDETLSNSPRNLLKSGLIYPLVKKRIFLGLEGQYTGRRKSVLGNDVDGFFVSNLTIFSKRLISNLEVSAGIYNLFDKVYADPGGEDHIGVDYQLESIEQDGRTYRLKITYSI